MEQNSSESLIEKIRNPDFVSTIEKKHKEILRGHLKILKYIYEDGLPYNSQTPSSTGKRILNVMEDISTSNREINNEIMLSLSNQNLSRITFSERSELLKEVVKYGSIIFENFLFFDEYFSVNYEFTLEDYLKWTYSDGRANYTELYNLFFGKNGIQRLATEEEEDSFAKGIRIFEQFKILLEIQNTLLNFDSNDDPIDSISFLFESLLDYFPEKDGALAQTEIPNMVSDHFQSIHRYVEYLNLRYNSDIGNNIYQQISAAQELVESLLVDSPISYDQEFIDLKALIQGSPEHTTRQKIEVEQIYLKDRVEDIVGIFEVMGGNIDEIFSNLYLMNLNQYSNKHLNHIREIDNINDLYQITLNLLKWWETRSVSNTHIFRNHGEQLSNDHISDQFRYDTMRDSAGRFDANITVAKAFVSRSREIYSKLKKLANNRTIVRDTILYTSSEYIGEVFFWTKHKQIVSKKTKNILFVIGYTLPIEPGALPQLITAYPTDRT